jgi:hypothetical protein
VSPTRVALTAPIDTPGLRQTGPDRYEVVLTSQIWMVGQRGHRHVHVLSHDRGGRDLAGSR